MRPVMLFDQDCAFCRYWVKRWQAQWGDAVRFEGFQSSRLPEQFHLSREALAKSVYLLDPETGQVSRGADAVFCAIGQSARARRLHGLWQRSGLFRATMRFGYYLVAFSRPLLWKLMRMFLKAEA